MVVRRTVLLTRPVLLATLLALVAWPARADDPRGDARAHYAKGLELGSQNGYEGALKEFNEAYAISPQFAVLYNIGQAQLALGHTAEAIEALDRYLRDGGDRISAARRLQVERQIVQLRSKLPNPGAPTEAEAQRATAVAAGLSSRRGDRRRVRGLARRVRPPGDADRPLRRPGAATVARRQAPRSGGVVPGIGLPGGVHHLVLTAPGRRAADETLEIPEGGAALVICENLSPAAAAPVSLPRNPIEGPPVFSAVTAGAATPTVHSKTVAYLLGGLGLALGGTAIGVYLWNRSLYDNAQNELNAYNGQTKATGYDLGAQYNENVDTVNRNSDIAVGLAVASVGLLAGGAYLLLHERKRSETAARGDGLESWAAITPGGLALRGVW